MDTKSKRRKTLTEDKTDIWRRRNVKTEAESDRDVNAKESPEPQEAGKWGENRFFPRAFVGSTYLPIP